MRALMVIALVLAPVIARADDASRDLMIEYTRIAHDAALGGNCQVARDLADKVKSLDEAYYNASFATDTAIAPCLPPPAPAAPIIPGGIGQPLAPPSVAPAEPLVQRVPVQTVPDRPATPPLDGGKLVGEVLLGYLGAGLGLAIGGLIGLGLCADSSGEFACIGSLILGAGVGGTLLLAGGVWAVGSSGSERGSFGWTWFGALAGTAVAIGAAAGSQSDDTAVALLIVAPMVGALIGFNASRHWRDDGLSVGSLIRIDRGRASLGIPMVTHTEIRGTPTTTIPLLSGAF